MEAGTALTRIFEDAVASGAISIDDMFDADYVEIPDTNPLSTAPGSRLVDRALPPFRRRSSPRTAHGFLRDDRPHGYLPVHNQIYSHPQRRGVVVWNTANSQNRASSMTARPRRRPQSALPISSRATPRHGQRQNRHDARIDVPIRVNGRTGAASALRTSFSNTRIQEL